jgi:hypothetical protein
MMDKNLTTQVTFEYNQVDDILHLSLGTGEPSVRKEIDEYVMVDFGANSGAPIGFHILNIKFSEVESVQVLLQERLAKLTIRKKHSLVYWFSLNGNGRPAGETTHPNEVD